MTKKEGKKMLLDSFFEEYPVFSTKELKNYLIKIKAENVEDYRILLNYHIKKGRILKICRGLYAVVPLNIPSSSYMPDSFLIAGKRTEDSILGYHTAQEYYGNAYAQFNTRMIITSKNIRLIKFRGVNYKPIKPPKALVRKSKERFLVNNIDIRGQIIRITSKERTFVDMLDRINLCGGVEEVWRSLQMTEYINTDDLFSYLEKLENSVTAAKVGFFLERNIEIIRNNEDFLRELEKLKPSSICYFNRSRNHHTKVSKRWNLAIPEYVWNEEWEEI